MEMEGPSLVIACEELKPFLKKKISRAQGSAKLPFAKLKGGSLIWAKSWGKHLLLHFSKVDLRIHFLMFGSYRIDSPRENRVPKLRLIYADHEIDFYSCAIKVESKGFEKNYDWSVDLMSKKWDPAQAVQAIRKQPQKQIADLLMDQSIFSGLGNIMKNEILFNLGMHPETTAGDLTAARVRALVAEAESYAWKFYDWKKANVLKRNWRIMRKRICPRCGRKVTKKETGKLKRWSHFCRHCQIRR